MNRRGMLLVACAAVPAIVAAGCGGGGASGPPEIVLGRTECEQCHMIITELRFAGAYRTSSGEEHRFDDIGDMVEYAQQNGEVEGSEFWVFDYDTEEPLRAEEAGFVLSEELSTPMDWSVAAFPDASAAEDFVAASGGEVIGWDALLDHVEAGADRGSQRMSEEEPHEHSDTEAPASGGS